MAPVSPVARIPNRAASAALTELAFSVRLSSPVLERRSSAETSAHARASIFSRFSTPNLSPGLGDSGSRTNLRIVAICRTQHMATYGAPETMLR